MTHARMHSLQVDDLTAPSDSDDESGDKLVGVRAAQQRLQNTQQMYGTPGGQTPPRWVTLGLVFRVCRVQQLHGTPRGIPWRHPGRADPLKLGGGGSQSHHGVGFWGFQGSPAAWHPWQTPSRGLCWPFSTVTCYKMSCHTSGHGSRALLFIQQKLATIILKVA